MEPPRPPVAFQYLFDYLFEVGPTSMTALGAAPLTWPEIDAWLARIPRSLQPWELLTLRRLSAEWLRESETAKEFEAPAPYAHVSSQQKRAVASRLKDAIKGLGRGGTFR